MRAREQLQIRLLDVALVQARPALEESAARWLKIEWWLARLELGNRAHEIVAALERDRWRPVFSMILRVAVHAASVSPPRRRFSSLK